MQRKSRLSGVFVALGLLAACGGRSPGDDARYRAALAPEEVVARVNGVPITRADVGAGTAGEGHPGLPAKDETSLVEGIVRQELAAQKAVELGLDPGPEYRAELGRLEAQVAAFKRQKLAALYDRQLSVKADVSDEDAKRYYAAEGARIRTEVHLWQILVRDEARIEQARRDLESGVPFEEVARRQFANLPEAAGPFWDLGWLRFSQIPEGWRDVVPRLREGETSGVLRGPKSRLWIVKLVGRRENPDLTFEAVKPVLLEVLRGEKAGALRADAERQLRSGARIVYAGEAAAAR